MEAIVATMIATIAVVGLAHSFGVARGLIDRYAIARAALGVAQGRLESLHALPLTDPALTAGVHPAMPLPLTFRGNTVGEEIWRVEWVDDPADGLGAQDLNGDTDDLRRVTVVVSWTSGGEPDSLTLQRLFLKG